MRMTKLFLAAAAAIGVLHAVPAFAQGPQCGNTSAGFDAWVADFKQTAAANGVSQSVLSRAFANVNYNKPTIAADRVVMMGGTARVTAGTQLQRRRCFWLLRPQQTSTLRELPS